jgi:hypothetical protein
MSNLTFTDMEPISTEPTAGSEMWAIIDGWEFACITEHVAAHTAPGLYVVRKYQVELIDCGRVLEFVVSNDNAADKALESAKKCIKDICTALSRV